MALRRILQIEDLEDKRILKTHCHPIKNFTPALRALAADMFETMHAANGVGLAAPQIGKISDKEEIGQEGCLSLPGRYGDVPRAAWVTVDYQDLDGKRQRIRKAGGLLGRALQHEIDHLDGVLFTERMRDLSTLKDLRSESPNVEEPAI